MLGTLGLLIALSPQAAPAAAPSAPGQTVTVGSAVAQQGEGMSVVANVETRNHIALTVGGAKLRDFDQLRTDRRSFDALVVTRTADTAVIRLQYGVCTSKVSDDAVQNEQPIKLSEHRYLLTRSGTPAKATVRELVRRVGSPARITVLDADPSEELAEVGDDVAEQIVQDVKELLEGGRWSATVAGKPLAVGQPIPLSPEAGRALFAEVLPELVVTRFELTPRAPGADPERVAFGVVASATMKEGDDPAVASTFELSGELKLARADGRLVSLDLSGPLHFSGATDRERTKIEVVGTGTVTWTYRAEPLPKR